MIVRCASCNTEFALDDRQVGPDGASVRCSVCQSVFRIDGEALEDEPPWQVRTLEDLLFTAPDLGTLRAWILEGRLHPDDKVSRTGRHFVRLGDMPEFSAAFEGFSGLPQLLALDDGRPPSERSARDVLGPPPAFGTEGANGG
ncbi:MAG: zinc-ribbon domain-containing protein, partial [Deltaproteobacteria bacterium]|nr:zinc-ribbon domain-containing protein [Nannocystaceae bacterium]